MNLFLVSRGRDFPLNNPFPQLLERKSFFLHNLGAGCAGRGDQAPRVSVFGADAVHAHPACEGARKQGHFGGYLIDDSRVRLSVPALAALRFAEVYGSGRRG